MLADPKSSIALLPDNPGVYQFLDTAGNVLYVGKAKNIKKRVSSYFFKKPIGENKCAS